MYKSFGVVKYVQKVMDLRGYLSLINKTTTFIEKNVMLVSVFLYLNISYVNNLLYIKYTSESIMYGASPVL